MTDVVPLDCRIRRLHSGQYRWRHCNRRSWQYVTMRFHGINSSYRYLWTKNNRLLSSDAGALWQRHCVWPTHTALGQSRHHLSRQSGPSVHHQHLETVDGHVDVSRLCWFSDRTRHSCVGLTRDERRHNRNQAVPFGQVLLHTASHNCLQCNISKSSMGSWNWSRAAHPQWRPYAQLPANQHVELDQHHVTMTRGRKMTTASRSGGGGLVVCWCRQSTSHATSTTLIWRRRHPLLCARNDRIYGPKTTATSTAMRPDRHNENGTFIRLISSWVMRITMLTNEL